LVSASDLLRDANDVSFSTKVSSFDSSGIETFDNGVDDDNSLGKVLFDCENENVTNVGIIPREITIDITRKLILLLNMNVDNEHITNIK
jgi:hypothetical protein